MKNLLLFPMFILAFSQATTAQKISYSEFDYKNSDKDYTFYITSEFHFGSGTNGPRVKFTYFNKSNDTVFVKALYDPTGIVYSAFGSTTFDTIKYSNPYSDVNYFYVSTSCVKEWLDATGKHMKDTVWNQFDTTFLVGTASVKEQIKVQLILYPNPTSQYLNLPKISEAKELSIYNTIGQVVLHQESNISQSLDVSNFTKGFYFLTLYDKDRNRIGQGSFYKE